MSIQPAEQWDVWTNARRNDVQAKLCGSVDTKTVANLKFVVTLSSDPLGSSAARLLLICVRQFSISERQDMGKVGGRAGGLCGLLEPACGASYLTPYNYDYIMTLDPEAKTSVDSEAGGAAHAGPTVLRRGHTDNRLLVCGCA